MSQPLIAVHDAALSLGTTAAQYGYWNVLVSNTPKLTLKPDLIYRMTQVDHPEPTREPDPDFMADVDLGYTEPA